MEALEKANTYIPIAILEEILNNDDIFKSFITEFNSKKSLFIEFPISQYIEALNDLMAYKIQNENEIQKKIFEKMNYINTYYKAYNKNKIEEYSYDEYLEKTNKIITINRLHSILSNQAVYEKFMNYNQYKKEFDNIPIEKYIEALSEMISYYETHNIKIHDDEHKRFNNIKNQYIHLFSKVQLQKQNDEDLNKTNQIVPISTLELILSDNQVFNKFINHFESENSLFKGISITEYVNALNDLMTYKIQNENEIEKRIFERMNYINTYYKTYNNNKTEEYSYEEYLKKAKKSITINRLHSILSNQTVYEKFMNYNQYKTEFDNIPIEQYIEALNEMISYYETHNIQTYPGEYTNLMHINRQYVCEFANIYANKDGNNDDVIKKQINNEKPCIKTINPNLEKYIMQRIPNNLNPFELARAIYLELCNVLTYNETFGILNQNIKHYKGYMIYHQPTFTITKKHNKIVCSKFAEIYATLLNKNGIKAIVKGEFHKYVLFTYKGIAIQADGTNAFQGENEQQKMPDLTRVKIGLKTLGLKSFNTKYDITTLIEEADLKIMNEKQKSKNHYLNIEQEYRNIKQLPPQQEENIDTIMTYLGQLSATTKLTGLDYTSYLAYKMFTRMSQEKQQNIKRYTCYKKVKRTHRAILILDISTYSSNHDTYYVFEENQNPLILNSMEIYKMIKEHKLIIKSENFKNNLEGKVNGMVR